MKVGEIFIQLGFEVQGKEQGAGFQSVVDSIAKSTAILVETIEDLRQEFIEHMEGTKKTTAVVKKAGDETEKNTKKTKENKVAITQQVGELWKARIALAATGAAIMYATQKASAYAQSLNIFTNVTGLSSIELQKWQQAAAAAGISGDEMAATIRNLQKAKTDVLLGQGSESQMRAFSLFGIGANEDPMVMLDKIKAKLGTLPRALESRMLEGMGFSDSMQSFLREAKNLPSGDEGLILNEKELKRLKEFNVYFNQTMDNVKRQMYKFGVAMSPVADLMLYAFARLSKATVFISDKLAQLNKFTDGKFFKGLTLAALGLAAALFPGAFALGMFIVMLEEVLTHMQGGRSIFGIWIKDLTTLKGIIESVVALMATIISYIPGVDVEEVAQKQAKMAEVLKGIFQVEGLTPDQKMEFRKRIEQGRIATPEITSSVGAPPSHANLTNNNNFTFNIDGAKNPTEVASAVKLKFDNVTNNAFRQNPIAEGKPK